MYQCDIAFQMCIFIDISSCCGLISYVCCLQIAEKIQILFDSIILMLLRLDFLRIVCSYEYYFFFNLLFGIFLIFILGRVVSFIFSIQSINFMFFYIFIFILIDRGQFYELILQYRQQYFLVGLVLFDLKVVLDIQ